MQNELQIWQLVMEASLLVQGVMAILLAASVASWMVIFRKRRILAKAEKAANAFEERFWSGTDLTQLHEGITGAHRITSGMERIFDAGFAEFLRMRDQGRIGPNAMVEGSQRAMRIALTRETEDLEHHLNFLATTSFHQLANVNQATIAMVAPGISEALVATAMGLFAAIPAVIGYNRFSNQVDRLEVRYDNFKEEFSSILQRQAHALSGE